MVNSVTQAQVSVECVIYEKQPIQLYVKISIDQRRCGFQWWMSGGAWCPYLDLCGIRSRFRSYYRCNLGHGGQFQ